MIAHGRGEVRLGVRQWWTQKGGGGGRAHEIYADRGNVALRVSVILRNIVDLSNTTHATIDVLGRGRVPPLQGQG